MSDSESPIGEVLCEVLRLAPYGIGALAVLVALPIVSRPRRISGTPASRRLDKQAIQLRGLEPIADHVPEQGIASGESSPASKQ